MTEISEISDKSSVVNNLDENSEIRCPICSDLVNIFDADLKNDKFSISCDNNHKENFIYYDSFNSFLENTSKILENILCNNCKKSQKETSDFYRCKKCYLFLCSECKIEHTNKNLSHSDFTELKNIDNSKDEENLYNIKKPNQNEINKEYNNIKKNITICKNISKLFNEWINELTQKFNKYMILINNYISFEKIIISNIKHYYDMNDISINNKIFENYDILYPNKYFIDNYIKTLNIKLNIDPHKLEQKSSIFCDIIKNFDEIDNYFKLNQKPMNLIGKSKSEKLNNNIELKMDLVEKISDKKNIKFNCDNEYIKCFNSFRNDNYLIAGTTTGDLNIYEINSSETDDNNSKNLKLKINIYEQEEGINNICIINRNIIIVSDGKNSIKILNFPEEDITEYSLMQNIDIKSNNIDNNIYSIIPLTLLKENKAINFFCTSDDNDIILYKENIENKNFEIYKKIKINTSISCLFEINNKYLIAALPKKNKIIFFDIKNGFKYIADIKGIKPYFNSQIFTLIHSNKILIVAVEGGFELINLNNFSKIKSVHSKYDVINIMKLDDNCILCCSDDKNNENKIRKFKIEENNNYNFKKIDEKIIIEKNDILNMKLIQGKIFFLSDNKELYFLK